MLSHIYNIFFVYNYRFVLIFKRWFNIKCNVDIHFIIDFDLRFYLYYGNFDLITL